MLAVARSGAVHACGGSPPANRPRCARLGDTLAEVLHALAGAPYLSVIRARAGPDRARRAEAALSGGAEALLASYAELPGRRQPDLARLATPYPESGCCGWAGAR